VKKTLEPRRWRQLALALAGAAFASAVWLHLTTPTETRGRVVDQDTNEPIAGAIVVARYFGGISWGGSSCNRAESAISDADGWFTFPIDAAAGGTLMEAYKRGYDRGNPSRAVYPDKALPGKWRISILKWSEDNMDGRSIGQEPEIYSSEEAAQAASGRLTNVYLRKSSGSREARLRMLHIFQTGCGGPAKTTPGLAPFIEAILAEQIELNDQESAIGATRRFLEWARERTAKFQATGK
jgi:hypothetical protein